MEMRQKSIKTVEFVCETKDTNTAFAPIGVVVYADLLKVVHYIINLNCFGHGPPKMYLSTSIQRTQHIQSLQSP